MGEVFVMVNGKTGVHRGALLEQLKVREVHHLLCGQLIGWTTAKVLPTFNHFSWTCCMCRERLRDGYVSFWPIPKHLRKFDNITDMINSRADLALAEIHQLANRAKFEVDKNFWTEAERRARRTE